MYQQDTLANLVAVSMFADGGNEKFRFNVVVGLAKVGYLVALRYPETMVRCFGREICQPGGIEPPSTRLVHCLF